MNWQVVWFIVNMFFVTSLIATLFLHRSVSMARLQRASESKIKQLTAIRNWLWVVTAIFFLSMSGSFLADMYYSG